MFFLIVSQPPSGHSIGPGTTVLTRIRRRATALARLLEWLIIAAFIAPYATAEPAEGPSLNPAMEICMRPASDEMCTLEPPPCSAIHGITLREARAVPIMSTVSLACR